MKGFALILVLNLVFFNLMNAQINSSKSSHHSFGSYHSQEIGSTSGLKIFPKHTHSYYYSNKEKSSRGNLNSNFKSDLISKNKNGELSDLENDKETKSNLNSSFKTNETKKIKSKRKIKVKVTRKKETAISGKGKAKLKSIYSSNEKSPNQK